MDALDGWTNITVRLPRRLVAQIRGYARGDGSRPPASINATAAYLLDRGLATVADAAARAEMARIGAAAGDDDREPV